MDGGRRGRRKVVPAAGRHHGATPARFLHRSRIVPSRAGPMAPAKGHGNRMSQQTTIRKLAALVNTPVDKRSEEHTSELQSLMRISYAVFCLKKKDTPNTTNNSTDTTTHYPTREQEPTSRQHPS